jgi:CHASE1-domain containing sensor protein
MERVAYLWSLLDSRLGNLVFGALIAGFAWHFVIAPELRASREVLARELENNRTALTQKLEVFTARLDAMALTLSRIASNGDHKP